MAFTERQAKEILAMSLGSLTKMSGIELQNEKKSLCDEIADYKALLSSEDLQKQEVRNRLSEIVRKYGDARRTELAQIDVPKDEKEAVAIIPEDCVVILNNSGEIKRVAASAFKTQKRAGKGVKTTDSGTLAALSTNTVDTLLLFSNKGKMYRILVDKIPAGTTTIKGGHLTDLISLEFGETVSAATTIDNKDNKKYVVFITKNGQFKKTLLEEYLAGKKTTGIQAIKLNEGDNIVSVHFCNEEDFVLFTKEGMSIHFETKSISPIGKITLGVKSIKLNEGDEVVAAVPLFQGSSYIAVFTSSGYGKKMSINEFPIQSRYGKGLSVLHNSLQGTIVAATSLSDADTLLLNGVPNSICIAARDLPAATRTSAGNIMIKGSTVQSVAKL